MTAPETAVREVVRPCEVCRSPEQMPVLDGVCDYITGERFRVRRCASCEIAMTEPRPESVERFYPARYRCYAAPLLGALKTLYGWRARGWVKRLGASGVALEIGCGDGWMLRALREHGWRVLGNERSVESGVFAHSVNKLPLFVGDLDALRPVPSFDAIILFQVLEHLPDPLSTLLRCSRLLKPGGHVIVAVPNFSSWQARVFGRAWFHLDVPRHLYHFSPRSLSYALNRAGLDIVRTRFVSLEHDPYGWLQSFLNRLGFAPNLLTKVLMGIAGREASALQVATMAAVSAPVGILSLALAVGSWLARSGAIVEVWAVKA